MAYERVKLTYYYTRGMAWFLVYVILTLLQNKRSVVQLFRTSVCVTPSSIPASLCFELRLEMGPFFETL